MIALFVIENRGLGFDSVFTRHRRRRRRRLDFDCWEHSGLAQTDIFIEYALYFEADIFIESTLFCKIF